MLVRKRRNTSLITKILARGGRGGFIAEKEVGKWIEDALPL